MTHVKALQAGQSSQPGDIWAHYAGVRPDIDEFGLCSSLQQNLENRYNYHIDTATGRLTLLFIRDRLTTTPMCIGKTKITITRHYGE